MAHDARMTLVVALAGIGATLGVAIAADRGSSRSDPASDRPTAADSDQGWFEPFGDTDTDVADTDTDVADTDTDVADTDTDVVDSGDPDSDSDAEVDLGSAARGAAELGGCHCEASGGPWTGLIGLALAIALLARRRRR